MSTPKAFDYATLQAMLRTKIMVNIANNTIAHKDIQDCITVLYHGNIIAQVYPDRITIYNQGWYTSTTKERLNWLLNPIGYILCQEDFKWWIYYIRDNGGRIDLYGRFMEGMTLEY